MITPEKAASKMLRALEKEKRLKSFPWPLAMGVAIARALPRCLSEAILGKGTRGRLPAEP